MMLERTPIPPNSRRLASTLYKRDGPVNSLKLLASCPTALRCRSFRCVLRLTRSDGLPLHVSRRVGASAFERGFNDKLAVRDTDLKLDSVRGDRLPGKRDNARIGLLLADDFELDRGVDRT